MELSDLTTPAAIVDLDLVERNCDWMGERMAGLGVRLRPHVKTHKTIEGALLQCGGAPGPITVSTLAEARFFADAGFTDITWAVPAAAARLPQALELVRRGVGLGLIVDNETSAAEIERCAQQGRVTLSVLLEVDSGHHRTGVDPDGELGVRLAKWLTESPHVLFRGILTHAGHAYLCRDAREIAGVARQEREVMVRFARRLEEAGAAVRDLSVGSTPTMCLAADLDGVTEARPGNYVFFDAFQAAIGACRLEDCAFSILTTVIGCYPFERRVVLDAGSLALSKDLGARHIDDEFGYGAVLAAGTGRHYWEVRVVALSQEHGHLVVNSPRRAEEFPVGTRLQIVPNHSCLSAALFDRYHVVRGTKVVDEWRPVRGW